MYEINLFCFGFGQVAKSFINKFLKNKIKINLITTSRNKTGEYNYLNLKYINFNFDEKSFDQNLLKEIKKFSHILISTPPISSKDLFLELLKLNNNLLDKSKWITYLSSTSVYGDHKGAWVDENSKLFPGSKKERLDLKLKIDGRYCQKIFQYKYLDLLVFTQKKQFNYKDKKNNSKIIKKKDS